MPDYDKEVTVTFVLNGDTPTWTFDPDVVDMDGTGKITFNAGASTTNFDFQGITIAPAPGTPPQGANDFTLDSVGPEQMIVSDNDADAGTYNYSVTVMAGNGTSYTSDPQIVNRK